jgi:hypothetical protein
MISQSAGTVVDQPRTICDDVVRILFFLDRFRPSHLARQDFIARLLFRLLTRPRHAEYFVMRGQSIVPTLPGPIQSKSSRVFSDVSASDHYPLLFEARFVKS